MTHTIDTLKELNEQRFASMDKAIVLLADEMARRLEILNHAHQQAREKERDFIGREAYETFTQRSRDDFAGLRREIQVSLNRGFRGTRSGVHGIGQFLRGTGQNL
jgi:hypothetical protein